METYIPTKNEFQDSIREAVEQAVTERLPEIIRLVTAKQFLTISDTCEVLNCTRRHLQYLRDSGQISYVKNGKKIYFKAEDIQAFMEKNRIEAE